MGKLYKKTYDDWSKKTNEELTEEERKLKSLGLHKVFTATEILESYFPESPWIVPGIIPEGLTLLVGNPKVGKSYLALNIAVALATGDDVLGDVKIPEPITVLYLTLEDRNVRLQGRLKRLQAPKTENLYLAPRWDPGVPGISDFQKWMDICPDTKFIIIDTLARFRIPNMDMVFQKGDPLPSSRDAYLEDYECISLIREFADVHALSIMLVHHTRKKSGDPIEMASGTFGLAGAVDTYLKLTRFGPNGELFVTGRDVEEKNLALEFELLGGWRLMGDASEFKKSRAKQEVLNVLKESKKAMTPKQVGEMLDKKTGVIAVILGRLAEDGSIEKIRYGEYIYRDPDDDIILETEEVKNDVSLLTERRMRKIKV